MSFRTMAFSPDVESIKRDLDNLVSTATASLKSVLDRDWKEEDLYAVCQIAANAITWRDRKIQSLKHRIEALENPEGFPMYEEPKPIEEYRPPAESPIGQSIERLAAYFEKHAKENTKRSEKLDKELQTTLLSWTDYKRNEHSSYYLSGKADAYRRAADKVREVLFLELLGEPEYPAMFGGKPERVYEPVEPKKPAEKWVIDMRSKGSNKSWLISGDSDVCGVFPSKAAAEEAIAHNGAVTVERRARRID